MAPPSKPSRRRPVRSLLVCLDLTAIDPLLIRYAGFTARVLGARSVTFFHAIQAYDLRDRAGRDFPEVGTELQAAISRELRRAVGAQLAETCPWNVVTRVGREDAALDVIDYIGENRIDLALIGQKYGADRTARYGEKIAAEAAADILFVPPNAEAAADPTLCAIDFSAASVRAFETALDISETAPADLTCYFVSDPSRAYFPPSTERSIKRHYHQCRQSAQDFLQPYGLTPEEVRCRIEPDGRLQGAADAVYQAALDAGARLIVAGAQGETGRVTSLLGNLCEGFRRMEKQIPVMIVKPDRP